jgi:hypothetical protein
LMFPAMPGVVDMEKVKQNKINNLREWKWSTFPGEGSW